jgi:hypothetical protein
MRILILIVTVVIFDTAFADSYTAPSGYLQIIGYKLQHTDRNGAPGIYVSGTFEAMADCSGADVLFDVLDRNGGKLGIYKIIYGPFYRHDAGDLAQGTYTPQGGNAGNIAAADHVAIRGAECTSRR